MLFEIIRFFLIIVGLIYAFLFLYGLICVIMTKDKEGLKYYIITSPSLIWILPLAAFRITYQIFKKQK